MLLLVMPCDDVSLYGIGIHQYMIQINHKSHCKCKLHSSVIVLSEEIDDKEICFCNSIRQRLEFDFEFEIINTRLEILGLNSKQNRFMKMKICLTVTALIFSSPSEKVWSMKSPYMVIFHTNTHWLLNDKLPPPPPPPPPPPASQYYLVYYYQYQCDLPSCICLFESSGDALRLV